MSGVGAVSRGGVAPQGLWDVAIVPNVPSPGRLSGFSRPQQCLGSSHYHGGSAGVAFHTKRMCPFPVEGVDRLAESKMQRE